MPAGNVDPAMLATFERETIGILDPALRSWALSALLAGLPYEARIRERNRALVAAGEFLGDVSAAERVRLLRSKLQAVRRAIKPAHPDFSTLEGCLARALLARDAVPTERQLRRILDRCN